MKKLVLLLMLVGYVAFGSDATRMATFQQVWETVRDKHFDLAGTGVDWDQVYKTYKPKAEAATSNGELRTVLSNMLGELGQSHFGILGADASHSLGELRSSFPGGQGVPGFEVSLVDDRVFITKIDLESDAAKKGLGIGTEILSARDKEMTWLVPRLIKAFKGHAQERLYRKRILNDLFSGPVGGHLPLKIRQGEDVKNVKAAFMKSRAVIQEVFGMRMPYQYDSKVLDTNIGYVHFSVFMMKVGMDFKKDMAGPLKEVDGLIIDLRGNPGGIAVLANNLSGRLIGEKGKSLGSMTNPGGTMRFPIFPQPGFYSGPVAVLIDEGSASTSEIMAQGLKDLGRVRVFGVNSAGAALPSIVVDLPNGDQFQYAVADFVSANGLHLEKSGVQPDEKTPHTLKSMAAGEDATLEAAKAWIVKSKGDNRESM